MVRDILVNQQSNYKPIADYGIIGNLRTAALVGIDGAIDWCCFPYLDSPFVFGALLDSKKGGTFRISPTGPYHSRQEYIPQTNVLRTTMQTSTGALELIDCMPVRGDLDGCGYAKSDACIHRFIRGIGGTVEVELLWEPRFDYARGLPEFRRINGGVLAVSGENLLTLGEIPGEIDVRQTPQGPSLRSRFTLHAGQELCVVTRWDNRDPRSDVDKSRRVIEETISAWRAWVDKPTALGRREWTGEHREKVLRSELTLKLMAQGDTGALAAAATTSLPETIGGVRNWDYRFAWIRDAAQIARAFFSLGHTREVDVFIEWAERVSLAEPTDRDLAIMYPLRPTTILKEEELSHLEGYKKSGPVRIGNEASEQLQLDIYGELFGAVHERYRLEERFDRDISPFLQKIANQACRRWKEPDFSIWEPRSGPAQFVYSKIMVWVALDRACDLHRLGLMGGDKAKWRATQKEIRKWVLQHGYNQDINSFVMVADGQDLDAANLLIPIYGFLPIDDPRVQNTIDRTLEELTVNDLVYRYRCDDGLPGEEGAFVLCTFWLIDALTLSGRLDEAHRIYDNLCDHANHLGLFAEQIDPHTGEFLGNFPQAYSHIGVINSALYLSRQEQSLGAEASDAIVASI